jgi:hypothetical protein
MRRAVLFRQARAVIRLRAAQTVRQRLELRFQSLNLLVLAKHDVAQFRGGALQEGDLGLNLFQVCIVQVCIVQACIVQACIVHPRSVAVTRGRRRLAGICGSERCSERYVIVRRFQASTISAFEIKNVSVPMSNAEQLRDFYRIIAGDERNSAVLKPAPQ